MEVNRLLSDELAYELKIRGLPVHNTVLENRSTLRGALRLEREGLSSLNFENINLRPQEELKVCSEKLLVLSRDLKNFDYSNKENEYKRLSTRLYHVQNRLKRISSADGEQQHLRNELLGSCLQLVDSLGTLKDTVNVEANQKSILDQENVLETSILDQDNLLLPEIVTTQNGGQSTRTYGEVQELQNSTMIRQSLELLEEVKSVRDQIRQDQDELKGIAQGKIGDNTRERSCPDMMGTAPQQNQYTSTFPYCDKSRPAYQVHHDDSFNEDLGEGHYRTEFKKVAEQRFSRDPFTKMPQQFQDPRLYEDTHFKQVDARWSIPYVDVSRWKIQFDGESSVTNFLERIEELRLSRGVSKEQLLRSAPELFTKNALIWFRTRNFHSWDDLVDQLKSDFQSYDYEFDLMEEIRRRTQGSKERVITYISAMESLFNKLGSNKPSEISRVKLIRRNLLPYIQSHLALHWIENISDLIRLCKAVEETELRTSKFVPPPTNYRQLLEPELAYRKPDNIFTSSKHPYVSLINNERLNQQDTASLRLPPDNKPKEDHPNCWNCGKTGHKFRKCQDPRRKFCYRCGRPNVIANTCPNCSEKNGLRRNQ